MKILNSFLLILIASVCIGQSNGGMWLPNLLEQLNEEEMHAMGMELIKVPMDPYTKENGFKI